MRVYKKIKLLMSVVTVFFLLLLPKLNAQPVTGLSGWDIYLDPGHSQFENMGIYGYSEAEKNLRVALNFRQMLLDWTDIDTVYICREDDIEYVSLTQRSTEANSLGTTWYHSIHSDASTMGSTANSTLLLWGQYATGLEKVPNGGKAMSDIMIGLLTDGMRTYTVKGSIGDCTFYQPTTTCPYLSVNRNTVMPSELSEAGFHTNPTQNQLNMNANWKRLEAKTMFWTILEYKNIPRPFVGTVVGIIKDIESGLAVNGAVVTLNGQTVTTDTWESLFYKYSADSTLLRNGFYYFEDVPAGTYPLQVTAPGFDPYTIDVTTVDTFFTFQDVGLISNVPPTIVSTLPAANDSLYPGVENLVINFSRPMDKTSVETNLLITPSVTVTKTWTNSDKTLTISTTNFTFNSQYEVTTQGAALDKYNHPLDGNGDGIGGDDYTFYIRTKVEDMIPPVVVDVYPDDNATNVELKPIINVAFNELLKTSTVSARVKIERNSTQTNAAYILRYYTVNGRGVINFFITTPLIENETYTIKILAGIEDTFGNPITSDYNFEFTTGNSNYVSQTIIDDFETGIASWWQPTTSGSTIGVLPDLTKVSSVTSIFNLNTGSTRSMMFEYGYDESAFNWLIREYRSVASPSFNNSNLLQTFIFGDGNSNKFRYCLRETAGTAPTNLEVSKWYDINWIGWKLVTWDLSLGETGTWLGNEILEPPFVFDSFQFTYLPGNGSNGTYYLDDLRTATFSPTDVVQENDQVPTNFVLEQNYPNPFNPSTQIKFSIPKTANVKLIVTDILGREVAILVNDNLATGNYSVNFDANSISSGIYFYTLITDNFKQSHKMILMK